MAASSVALNVPAALGRPAARPRFHRFWLAFRRNRGAIIGSVVVLVLVVLALLAPVLAPADPFSMSVTAIMAPPSPEHWFGTDQYGRDIVSRVLYGARLSLQTGLVAVAIAATTGSLLGLAAGYYGNLTDSVIMRVVDMLLAFPGMLLAMAIVAVLGPSLINVMIAVGIGATPTYARVVRSSVLSAKELPYVLAARSIGTSNARLMFVHILPNTMSPIIVLSSLSIAAAILSASGLSFIGLGAQPPTPEWGAMLNQGRTFLREAWWMTTFPGLAIMLTVMSINMIGDGLRDALDPRLRL
jgi:peptide/nickel transport system permease protein